MAYEKTVLVQEKPWSYEACCYPRPRVTAPVMSVSLLDSEPSINSHVMVLQTGTVAENVWERATSLR